MMTTGCPTAAMWRVELATALAVALLAAILAWADGPIVLRLPLGFVAVLLLPGYALTMLLLAQDDLDAVERLGLSLALSLAVLAVLAILLNATPWGFGYGPIVAVVTGWTTLALVGAWIRSIRHEAPPAAASVSRGRPPSRTAPAELLAAGLGATLGVAVLAYGYTVLEPPDDSTELYLLGPRGRGADFPRAISLGEAVPVTVGIANHESEATSYQVRAAAGGATLLDVGPIRLVAGESWEGPLTLKPTRAGRDQEIAITLHKEGVPTAYRSVRLWFDVMPSRGGDARSGSGPVGVPGMDRPEIGAGR